jgi:NTE family protein
MTERDDKPGRVALVLAGGGSRGAYEVGVARYIMEELPKELGREVPIDVFCGTSVGAINSCHLAAFADEPRVRARMLAERWRSLSLEHILTPDPLELVAFVRDVVGARPKPLWGKHPRGGLLDPSGLTKVLTDAIPFERIDEQIAKGRLLAASVSTTHIGTGRTVVFVQQQEEWVTRWGTHHTMERRSCRLRLEHALASAAIPFVFPAVDIGGQAFCDGGLRQNVPLSPARKLGANRLVVITPHHLTPIDQEPTDTPGDQSSFVGPAFLMGKLLNAVLLDRLDGDVDRLRRINDIIQAGTAEYGAGFIDSLNRQLEAAGNGALRPLHTVVIRSSADIGNLAGRFVRSEAFSQKVKGFTARALRRLAGDKEGDEADLLSYLLFDGEFAGELIALGEADARARRDELATLFEPMLQ